MLKRPAHTAGFTMIELIVTLTIFALLVALAVPTLSVWIRNTKVRASADALQNGIRLAQAEALRRSRQVVFSLTNSTTPQNGGFTAAGNGNYWSINTIPLSGSGETAAFIQSGVLTSSAGVGITGPAAICFNSVGRLVLNASTGINSGNCTTLGTGTPPFVTYNIATTSTTTSDRPLNVNVALGGQVHMCDPTKSITTSPEGC